MCTAICMTTQDHYFGRNLDLEYHYSEQVVILPRRCPLAFRHAPGMDEHPALIGMATMEGGVPLFYDAVNEHGVGMAALSFPGNARYFPHAPGKDNITPFELIPWVLGRCRHMDDVRTLLARISLLDEAFHEHLPLSPLHWIAAWKDECIVVESTADGLAVWENPAGVLTNNPPFGMQMHHLSRSQHLSPHQPENTLAPRIPLQADSNGMGTLGLPGDLTSPSRFVRAAYTLHHSRCGDTEAESVSQFFHILASVAHTRGSVLVHGKPEITVYSACCNLDSGMYYYTTYENSAVTGVSLHRANLQGASPIAYPLRTRMQIDMQN